MTWSRADNQFGLILGRYQVKNILEHKVGDSLLDLGCSDGWLTLSLAGNFRRVVGVDIDLGNDDTIPMLPNTSIDFVCSTIEKFTCRKKFDTVTLINVLEHVDDPVAALRKAGECVRDKGVVIIHVPNAEGFNRRLGLAMGLIENTHQLGEGDTKIGHKRLYDWAELNRDVWRAGLKLRKTGGIMFKPFSNEQMQRMAGWENAEKIFDGLCRMADEFPAASSPLWAVCVKGEIA